MLEKIGRVTNLFYKRFTSSANMSSLSRRACYKCGELGHHAEACSSPHRLCYNCKQPTRLPQPCQWRNGPWRPGWPWWIRRLWWTWRFRWRTSPGYLLQVRWTQPLRPRLPGSVNEVLCLRQAWTHLARLHRSERRPSQHCRQVLLRMRRGRTYLSRLPPEEQHQWRDHPR
ncbi:hypothetical protein B0T17DRAFT_380812 [Bombardia bombarda]|uniref:CCHC-type domain-containing protein n=1 Tax=Bombardia bombarda TaxID=252184 RepID=A0AA39WH00_9PEZI|nr:hypothetical protein B0T17DRAFT_380812 [Bombardia bombarda]